MVTIWKDLSSLKRFAGDKWEKAVIPSEKERAALKKWFVHHYTSFQGSK